MKRKVFYYSHHTAAFLTIISCFGNNLPLVTIFAAATLLFRHLLVSTIKTKHHGRLARP